MELADVSGWVGGLGSPDGTREWVESWGIYQRRLLWAGSTSTLRLLYSIPVGTEPLGLAIDYDGQTAYVTNYGDGTVSYFTVPG